MNDHGHRVVITGFGLEVPNGRDIDALWSDLLHGVSKTQRIEIDSMPPFLGIPVDREMAGADVPQRTRRQLDPFALFALVAGQRAVWDAALPAEMFGTEQMGIVVGTGIGGVSTLVTGFQRLAGQGLRGVAPSTVPMMMPNAAAAHLSMHLGSSGPSLTVSSACASGADAIATASSLIRRGEVSTALAGGTEAAVNEFALAAFSRMHALSRRFNDPRAASRPFDAHRDGFILSEGAGFVVLEELDTALARGARVQAEVLGWAQNSDAFHIVAPTPSGYGAADCMRRALADGGLTPGDVVSINAHGTSTELNDLSEGRAINSVFGIPGPPVTAVKSVTGHSLGAAGAVEAIVAARTASSGRVPPTANLVALDHRLELDVVVGVARELRPGPVVSNSFGFGGHNCVLVLGPASRGPGAMD